MLYGIDVSNWNSPKKETYRDADFMIHKATEGKSFVDKTMNQHVGEYNTNRYAVPDKEPLLGFYHFAQPITGNTVASEAENFLKAVKKYVGDAIFALDLESGNQTFVDWALEWLNYVYEKTGVKALVYSSASNLKLFKEIQSADYGLWVANYKRNGNHFPVVKPETIGPWDYLAIWQWSNGQTPHSASQGWFDDNIDQNVFNGDAKDWKMYCYSSTVIDKSTLPWKPIDYIMVAYDVMNGHYGCGKERIQKLTQAGFNPQKVQDIINLAHKEG